LSGANLQHANLSNALCGAEFYFADLRGANLSRTILQENQGAANASQFFAAQLDPGILESLDIYSNQLEKPSRDPLTAPAHIPAWNGFNA
jgi:uncharacterized protein YjbI with pentapeptide repeats